MKMTSNLMFFVAVYHVGTVLIGGAERKCSGHARFPSTNGKDAPEGLGGPAPEAVDSQEFGEPDLGEPKSTRGRVRRRGGESGSKGMSLTEARKEMHDAQKLKSIKRVLPDYDPAKTSGLETLPEDEKEEDEEEDAQ
eukprot:TRINITY_DN68416_c0_g1_i1.p1 TRINITY_DN68416_c0_g1~~TRINITY_DN68416_c0_g1_i1.p1  ORF type:complete len:137 (-),score=21.64 TRINITY_DN68416_c0_g1_i1:102-512(-)